MRILFALSLLVMYASAKFTITKIEADDGPCNLTLPMVTADAMSHFPERRVRVDGAMYWDNVMERFVIIGTELSSNGEVKFEFFQYYLQYTDKIRINARTEFVVRTDPTTGVASCHKLAIRTGFNYRPPGIPTDYKCVGDFVQGWKDQYHQDGVDVKFCTKENGKEYSIRTATKKLCYPVSHSDNYIDNGRLTILEETDYYNWRQIGANAFPELPQACV